MIDCSVAFILTAFSISLRLLSLFLTQKNTPIRSDCFCDSYPESISVRWNLYGHTYEGFHSIPVATWEINYSPCVSEQWLHDYTLLQKSVLPCSQSLWRAVFDQIEQLLFSEMPAWLDIYIYTIYYIMSVIYLFFLFLTRSQSACLIVVL